MKIPLRTLGDLIARCWQSAEDATAKIVEAKYFDPPEEVITFLFARELHSVVSEASRAGCFEQAFREDVSRELPDFSPDPFRSRKGLIARVNFHRRWHEGHCSGSDLGVVVTRPSLHGSPTSSEIQVSRGHAYGLMAQAKLNVRKRDGALRWGPLTENQEELLPRHSDYCALLLYQLKGPDRAELAPYRWLLCRGFGLSDFKEWLHSDTPPEGMASRSIIQALSAGKIGTDSKEIIENIIGDPQASSHDVIEINVSWMDDDGPHPGSIYLHRRASQDVQQRVRVGRSSLE